MNEVEAQNLIFFDTFSHDMINEELNLDLVQFPKPVYITEVRIIPLGARVQADFPGGVRLGATNPSQFHVDLFVNDLGKPGASTFENLGSFDYNQNDCINMVLECKSLEEGFRQIPTDGLVLRGWYTTITLAIYGTFTKQITEQIASPPVIVVPPPLVSSQSAVPVQITTGEEIQIQQTPSCQIDWSPEIAVPVPALEPYVQTQPELYAGTVYPDNYENREYQQHDYYPGASADVPKDPRTFTNVSSSDWNQNTSGTESRDATERRDRSRSRDWERNERRSRPRSRRRSQSSERPTSRPISRTRERSRAAYSRSSSRDRDYGGRLKQRDWSRSPEYRSCHTRRNRGSSYDRSRRDSSYEKSRDHDRRSPPDLSEEHRSKRPRTPPTNSPGRRPRSPERRPSSSGAGSEEDLRYRNKTIDHYEKSHSEKIQTIRVIDHHHTSNDEQRQLKSSMSSSSNSVPPKSPATIIVEPTTTVESPTTVPIDDPEQSPLTEEQFEPILSDEEMIGDDAETQFELDYDSTTDDVEDVIKIFNPYTNEIEKFELKNNENQTVEPLIVEQLIIKEFECITKLLQKFNGRIDFFRYSDFENLNPDTKECWVHFAEQLTQMLNQINCLNKEKIEEQIRLILAQPELSKTLCDWIKIGINFKLSLSQRQPGYKIRHIKAGIRLVETLCCFETFARCILVKVTEEEKINIFMQLFEMYSQTYMALSIKLMIIKAVHSALDTRTGMEQFLCSDLDTVSDLNGYQILLQVLNVNPPTRVKFAIKSLIKKINLYETMKLVQDIVSKWFILEATETTGGSGGDKWNLDDIILLRNCLDEILAAYTWDEISYTQPKRFLPVSAKFEITKDQQTTRTSTKIGFHSHFKINAFLESILLLVTHQNLLPDDIIGCVLDIILAISKSGSGLDYFCNNIQTTNFLIKSLLLNTTQVTTSTMSETIGTSTSMINNDDGGDVDEKKLKNNNIIFNNKLECFENLTRSERVGIELSFKLQTKYYLDAIINIKYNNNTNTNNYDKLVDNLHLFYCLLLQKRVRNYVIDTICMENNILSLINLIEIERKMESQNLRQQTLSLSSSTTSTVGAASTAAAGGLIEKNNVVIVGGVQTTIATTTPSVNSGGGVVGIVGVDNIKQQKSPVLSYAIDILDCVIRNCTCLDFLEEYGMILLDLCKSHELFEQSVATVLQEMCVYLKPLEITNVFQYGDITQLCELIKRSIEFVTTFPGDLMMALKIIKHLGIPAYENCSGVQQQQPPEHLELKYKFIILEFYSADGIATILSILDKITAHFEQPGIHSATLASVQGVHAIQIVFPAIQILQKMLTYVIQCRNTQFKDLTSIEPLLKTYILMHHVPVSSSGYQMAQQTQQEIIKTLLAYTQPSPLIDGGGDNNNTNESIHKSLWTQMLSEIIKTILTGPHTFVPGLIAFSELLPLPLPIVTREPLTSTEIIKLTTDRQLWSAHLHPQSSLICDMIQTICVSSYSQLTKLLSNICLQLADLAPNMTLLVAKTIVDLILNEQQPNSGGSTSQLARLLKFLSNLVNHPSIKISILTILHGKFMDILSQILTNNYKLSTTHIKAEYYCNKILQNLLNADITLITLNTNCNREMTLACSIPAKESIINICNAVIENFTNDEMIGERLLVGLKTMKLLTEHDITVYHLRATLENKKERFQKTLKRIVNNFKENPENVNNRDLIISFLKFLLKLFTIEQLNKKKKQTQILPTRTITVTIQQLISILAWNVNEETTLEVNVDTSTTSNVEQQIQQHPFKLLQTLIEDANKTETISLNDKKSNDLILENLKLILDYLVKDTVVNHPPVQSENSNTSSTTSSSETSSSSSPIVVLTTTTTATTVNEPFLPQAEGIVTQYASRPFYIIKNNDSGDNDERLNINYWMKPHRMMDESEIEHITCDLSEIIRTLLSSSETNITAECKRLLHLSASPQTQRERTTTAPCYRTRRVEVEPTTGRPEKKIFVTPMRGGRGFARTPPSRGDLFRSRPPNTSRPPSLHVDDFLALETCNMQPTGPTGYNKLSREIINIRGGRGGRGRGGGGFSSDRGRITTVGGGPTVPIQSPVAYRQATNYMQHVSVDPNIMVPPQHFRTATSEPVVTSHFQNEQHSHYQQTHFVTAPRSRGARGFTRPSRAFNR